MEDERDPMTADDVGTALEELATISRSGRMPGQASPPQYGEHAVKAFLEMAESRGGDLFRGELREGQVPGARRLLMRAMHLAALTNPEALPKQLQEVNALPYGARMVIITGMLQASVDGRARGQALSAMTNGQASIAAESAARRDNAGGGGGGGGRNWMPPFLRRGGRKGLRR